MVQDMLGILVNTDAGAVQRLHDFTVNSAWHNTQLAPYRLTLGRCSIDINQLAFLLAKLAQGFFSYICSNLIRSTSVYWHSQIAGYSMQLPHIFYTVVRRLACSGSQQRQSHTATMVGVGSRTTGDTTSHVSGRNC
jgi:hypothetical protein